MLADGILFQCEERFVSNGIPRAVFDCIRSAPRISITDEVVEVARTLRVPDEVPVPLPFPEFWVEWTDIDRQQHGLLVDEEAAIYFRTSDKAVPDPTWMPGYRQRDIKLFPLAGPLPRLAFKPDTPMEARFEFAWIKPAEVGRFISGVFHMMASPKVTEYRDPAPTTVRRVGKQAVDPPLLSYREVILNLTPEERAMSCGDGSGPGKALHMCRSFMRVRLGRVERVKAHWRGSQANGVVISSHKVTR